MQVEVTTHQVALDAEAAGSVSELCREIVLHAQRTQRGGGGLDGVSYHAAHWLPGGMLAAQTWSPAKDTIAADFIALEDTLQSFAESNPADRPKLRTELVERSSRLGRRLRAEPDSRR
jgi:hypothetical protein